MSIRMVDHSAKPSSLRAPSRRSRPALIRAAARVPTVLDAQETELNGDAVESFTVAVGGRQKLLETLAIADADGKTDKVIDCLLSPKYAEWSLRRICTHAGITIADLFASYKKALFVAAHVQAAHLITSKLPPVVADVMARALPQDVQCPRCRGTPTTPGTSDCPECKGIGTVVREPDVDRQKLALELGRLLERKGGIVMQQNAIAAGTTALQSTQTGSLEQLQQAVGDLLFSPARRRAAAPVIDVAVQDPREPAPPVAEPRPDLPIAQGEPDESDETEEDEDDDDEPLSTRT